MDFDVNLEFQKVQSDRKVDVIILACYSKNYFTSHIKKANANPILWATHLMAPEAYTLKAAIDGWLLNETGQQIDERAAQIYNKYQKCVKKRFLINLSYRAKSRYLFNSTLKTQKILQLHFTMFHYRESVKYCSE